MSDSILDLMADAHFRAARLFARSKGRLPSSDIEFVVWLLEFNKYEGELLNNLLKAYQEYAATVSRPMILEK